MSKITLNNIADITQSTSAQTTINSNSATIQAAFDNTLSRDGTFPNQMGSAIDMNSNQIVNLPSPTSLSSPARLADVQNLVAGGSITLSPLPTGGTQNQILTKNSSANFDASWLSSISVTSAVASNISVVTSTTPVPGLSVLQALSGASLPAGNASNLIFIASDTVQAGAGFLNGFEVSHQVGGSSATGGREAFASFLNLIAPTSASNTNRNYVAIWGNGFSAAGDGGTNTGAGALGAIFGSGAWGDLQSGATNMLNVCASEYNVSIRTGASAKHKTCLQVVQHSLDAIAGATTDAAIAISSQGSPATGLSDGLLFSDLAGAHGVKTAGTLIRTTGGTFATGVDLSLSTLTTSFKSNGFGVDGNGNVQGLVYTGTSVTTTGAHIAFSGTAVPAGGTTGSGFKISSVTNLGVFFGSGVPTLSAAQGSLYIRTDGSSTSTRMYINTTGSTTWTNVTTAA